MPQYKELTPYEADCLWRVGAEFQVAYHGVVHHEEDWNRWDYVGNKWAPSDYQTDLFRAEVE